MEQISWGAIFPGGRGEPFSRGNFSRHPYIHAVPCEEFVLFVHIIKEVKPEPVGSFKSIQGWRLQDPENLNILSKLKKKVIVLVKMLLESPPST